MATGPRFSVCIPNYNNGEFIADTIRSVLAQSYDGIEIVVSDNASTDDSVEVVRSFAADGVRLVSNPVNLGLSANFDRVVEASTGRHLLLLSADDLAHPNAFERYAEVLDDRGADADRSVLIAAYDVVDARGEPVGAMHRPPGTWVYEELAAADAAAADRSAPVEVDDGLDVLAGALRRRLAPAPFVATCFPRASYDAVGGYRSGFRAWPDTHFTLKLLSTGPSLVYVPERLFAYRVHQHNQFRSFDRQRLLHYQVDSYLHTVEFPADVLERVGVERDQLADAYARRAILGRARRAVAGGSPSMALRYMAFGLATHPRAVLRHKETYTLATAALLGPVGRWIAKRMPELAA